MMLPVGMFFVRNTPGLKGKIARKIMAAMSALDLRYKDSPLTSTTPGPTAGPCPGQRVALVDDERASSAGWAALLGELRDVRWVLLVAEGASARAMSDLARIAHEHASWLSACVIHDAVEGHSVVEGRGVIEEPSVGTCRELPDPDRGLRRDLGLGPGGWLLVRPDRYVAATGTAFTERVFADAIVPLRLTIGTSQKVAPGPSL
jgi:NADPH-dependent dioxygenase